MVSGNQSKNSNNRTGLLSGDKDAKEAPMWEFRKVNRTEGNLILDDFTKE